jgi:molybdopterin/thiamine biosynthesis adenylyltransferase
MSQTNPGLMKPLVPHYLNIRDVKIINETPPVFSLRVGNSPTTTKEITITGDVLCLLSLADGTRSLDEIYAELLSVNPQLTSGTYQEILDSLFSQRLILDGRDEGLLSPSLVDRYQRHLLFYSMFSDKPEDVQRKLQNSTVAVLGIGGIGTFVSYFLASAGVGTLHLIDGDHVETSNLTRQVLYNTHDVGRLKTEVAYERLLAVNPNVNCVTHSTMIQSSEDLNNVLSGIGPDLILVSADRPEVIQDWVDEYSVRNRIPWSSAGYAEALGICGPLFVPGRTGCRFCKVKNKAEDLEPHDRFASFPLIGTINQRFQPPSFGPLNGVVASVLAKETIAWLGGLASIPPSLGAMILIDAPTLSVSVDQWERREDCARCSDLFLQP